DARVKTITQPMHMNSRKTKPKKPQSWKKVTARAPMAMANPEHPSLKGSGAKESVMEFRLVPSRWVCTAPMYMKIEAARATRRLMMVIVALSGQKSSDLSV